MDPLIGTKLHGRYVIDARVARGGMGTIYRGHIVDSGLVVAVKVLHEHLQESEADVERFFREAGILAKLRHPNIVSLIDSGRAENGRLYLVMEFLYGQTLSQLMEGPSRPPLDLTVGIIASVLDAVGAAHARRLVHRDLTPSNILLARTPDNRDQVKIVDFGIAKSGDAAAAVTQTGAVVGTPGFLAPEQLQGGPTPDHRADIYAVGAVLYCLLAGRKPFDGPNMAAVLTKQALGTPDPIDLVALGHPAALGEVLSRALAKDPAARFQTAEEMREALLKASGVAPQLEQESLDKFRKDTPVRRDFGAVPVAPSAPLRSNKAVVWGTATALVAVAIVAAFLLIRPVRPPVEPTSAPVAVVPVRVGLSADLTSAQGRAFSLGVETAFLGINEESNGVFHRPLQLVALDDGGAKKKALENIAELTDENPVVALMGGNRPNTANVLLAEARKRKMLYFAPVSGDESLRSEPANVFHYRASDSAEIFALVETLVRDRHTPPTAVAVFAEDSDQGFGCAKSVVGALGKLGHPDPMRTVLTRHDVGEDPTAAVAALTKKQKKARAVVLCTSTSAAAKVIAKYRVKHPLFAGTSRIDADELRTALGENAPEVLPQVILSQVTPLFEDSAFAARFRTLLEQKSPGARPNDATFEGYITGRLLIAALERAGVGTSGEQLVAALARIGDLELGAGVPVRLSVTDPNRARSVWLTGFDASAVQIPIEKPVDSRSAHR